MLLSKKPLGVHSVSIETNKNCYFYLNLIFVVLFFDAKSINLPPPPCGSLQQPLQRTFLL